MRTQKKRQTDAGTIVLHWWLAASLVVSTLTGLRFAVDMPDTGYLKAVEPLLPVANIWKLHIFAGVSVMALAVAYPFYLRRTGLARRIMPDRARLAALLSPGQGRWGAVNVLLYWALFAALVAQMITGILLHRGYGGVATTLHLIATWLIIGYAVAHIVAHFLMGGVAQLMRVLRPSRIPVAAPPSANPAPFRRPSMFAGARILGISALAGVSIGGSFLVFDRASRDVLVVTHVDKSAAAALRADLSDPIWREARSLYVHTNQGVNIDGSGASTVEMRAVHDGESITFAFTWDDPTRSLKHVPLIKAADGWHGLFSETPEQRKVSLARKVNASLDSANFEGALAEDKFAIMLANIEKPFGPGAFHPGAKPLADKPPSSSGRGLHYTDDGSRVTLWLWHADGSESGRCESNAVGPAARPTNAEARGLSPYKGGYLSDASEATVMENFTPAMPRDWKMTVQPLRLPKQLAATRMAMGAVDLDPDHGEPNGVRWTLNSEDSIPWSAEADALIPVGTIIPGIVAVAPRPAGASDVACQAQWSSGRWTLIVRRRLATGREGDIAINRHTHMWVAAFDHTPANHTRHIRPLRLELQP